MRHLYNTAARYLRTICVGFFIMTLCTQGRAQAAPSIAAAATATAATPEALAQLALQRFATGSQSDFDSVDPDPSGRGVIAAAIHRKAVRKPNLGKVVWSDSDRAVLLLTGTVVDKDSGTETIRSRHFSGLYEVTRSANGWAISRQLPFDAGNRITSHVIDATISPGRSIDVRDTLGIVAKGQYGFAVRLNDQAQVRSVKLNGKKTSYLFGGGVLWIETPRQPDAKLSLEYSLAEVIRPSAKQPNAQPNASGTPDYGSFVNATVWTPVFDFDSANDTGTIAATIRIPAAYFLTTSVPQTETVKRGTRIVRGHTSEPEFILSLIYDRGWHPTYAKTGNFQFATFLTPDFRWSPQVMEKQVTEVDDILTSRFGPPQANYLGVAEERDLGPGGFRYRTNDLVVAGQGGGKRLMSSAADSASAPNAPLAHEVSHGWTMQATGPAANFLREGWATYCEWMFVGKQYGPQVEKDIWQTAYNYYFLGGHNGVRSILGNPDNGSIHYVKGAWILHMLEEAMGRDAFDRGMRTYIQIPRDQPAGYHAFIAAMSQAAGHDMSSFIMPWLSGKYVPDLEAQIQGSQIVITQKQPEIVFDLPLTVALTASGSVVDRPIHITGRTTTLDVADLGQIKSVRIDPDHEFLLQRHLGENVRFELRAPAAKTVALAGNFTLKPMSAVRKGDVWTLDIPMVNGRFSWSWQVDGKKPEDGAQLDGQPLTGVRYVKPEQPVSGAYPK
ncbi:MAG: M1 family aminopeptidase [Acidobacteriaceae bacterium]